MRRRRFTRVVAVLAALPLLVGGVALAQEADTLFIEGYDPDTFLLIYSASSLSVEGEGPTDCEELADTVNTPNPDDEFAYTDNGDGTATVGASGCEFTAVDVTGPEGQVNHGTVVSSFVASLHELMAAGDWEGGIGCLVSVIARSDYGKGDQQVQAGDEVTVSTDPTFVDLNVHEVRCGPPDVEGADTDGEGNGHGKPEWAGDPEHPDHPRNSNPAAAASNGKGRPGGDSDD